VVGEVGGMTALIIDDLISSGTTLARAAAACKTLGAKRVFAAASHGLFIGAASTSCFAQRAMHFALLRCTACRRCSPKSGDVTRCCRPIPKLPSGA
jgi:phosphoribosylpyrophosphate synthetase